MQYDFDDTRVKIGRSRNVEKRNKTLEASQDFQILVRRIFLGKGTYERMVHRSLRKFRDLEKNGFSFHLKKQKSASLEPFFVEDCGLAEEILCAQTV